MFLPSDQRKKRWILAVSGIVLFCLILLGFLRGPVVSFYLNKKIKAFNTRYNATLAVGSIRMTGLAGIILRDISLVPAGGDTLLEVDSLYAAADPWKLLTGRIAISEVGQKGTRVTFVRRDSLTNYMFLLDRSGKGRRNDTAALTDYARRAEDLFNAVFDKIPGTLHLRDLTVSDDYNGRKITFLVDSLEVEDHLFNTRIRVEEDSLRATWSAEGLLEGHRHTARLKLFCSDRKKLEIPYIRYRLGAVAGFDTLSVTLTGEREEDGRFGISGYADLRGLYVRSPRIAVDTVIFDHLATGYRINLGEDYIELDSATKVVFNRLEFNPYVRYRPHPSGQITLSLHKPAFPAQDLFSSFPRGLFTNLDGIRTRGDLTFDFNFFVDLAMPDSLKLQVELGRRGFGVISYGNADLSRLNTSFEYTAYEKGVPVKTFIVGPENPDFRPLDRISHYLQVSVLNSEDGAFFQHRGFMPDAFREALIQDIKERRFARGGSTITMQLVKNVFLSRNKTIGRKVEEMLLVWLLENQGITTKERMYEVYLNIIEWGPGIYGANEGARFYFNKDASRLNLAESIFMASIIPRPKWFRYSFTEDGHLTEAQAGFYRLLSEKMLAKGQITQRDFDELRPDVELKGPARLLLRSREVPADSLEE